MHDTDGCVDTSLKKGAGMKCACILSDSSASLLCWIHTLFFMKLCFYGNKNAFSAAEREKSLCFESFHYLFYKPV